MHHASKILYGVSFIRNFMWGKTYFDVLLINGLHGLLFLMKYYVRILMRKKDSDGVAVDIDVIHR